MTTETRLPPIHINGRTFQPRDEIHRRKLEALRVFVEHLLASPVRDRIAKIMLFGSVATGEARKDSDVDVMVFGFDDLDVLREAAYDAILELGDYSDEGIEALFETIDELIEPQSYFMYLVTNSGKEIFSVSTEQLKREEAADWLDLAQDYLIYAENSLAAEYHRAAADLAHNATELCAKGLLLFKMDNLPSTHGGLLGKFSEYYVKSGLLPRILGQRLSRSLEVRSWARYRRKVTITLEMAEENLALAKEMISDLKDTLKAQA